MIIEILFNAIFEMLSVIPTPNSNTITVFISEFNRALETVAPTLRIATYFIDVNCIKNIIAIIFTFMMYRIFVTIIKTALDLIPIA